MRKLMFAAALGAASLTLAACGDEENKMLAEATGTDYSSGMATNDFDAAVSRSEAESYYGYESRTPSQELQLAKLDNMSPEELRAYAKQMSK